MLGNSQFILHPLTLQFELVQMIPQGAKAAEITMAAHGLWMYKDESRFPVQVLYVLHFS